MRTFAKINFSDIGTQECEILGFSGGPTNICILVKGKLYWVNHDTLYEVRREPDTVKFDYIAVDTDGIYQKAPWWTNPNVPPMKVTCGAYGNTMTKTPKTPCTYGDN